MTAWVHYAEARGESAECDLRAFLNTLPGLPGFLGAELLGSPAQPGLALVASRWAGEVPPLALPDGVRAWVFEVLEDR
ncbi:hypothetical protein E5F05_06415 [Deinococcus metallilatus]|uniref:Antibiotic biosynthesis monooxygenase n=1 Tax=Deinococcus metallilatus TaxID=1211322 RepID=A0AAJ5F4C6_9DEIO|nr:hypothetical protein [Deinococcus metallilatus]MBB5294578.1 hypothetical protein [Deinococcus metallilatus]QBY07621.1 hypothetical protein E5F05_06415 [Deinococcus metallilatus]RXJ14037.1 hypothetical protein ERJ73_05250 [Deinococcus metallilatus]TLK30002.1 hypothetical protein FCS05_05565 [Deinococcus metallilatus]GMA15791.1 hypothetical protein GCM10025871_21220 [Deinococcus metallilatus]